MAFELSRRTALAAALGAGASLPFCGSAGAQPAALGAGRLYVTSWFGNAISVVDLAKGKAIKTIPVGVHDHNVFLSPDRREAWVANNNDRTISVIDTATDEVSAVLKVGAGPRHTFFSPDGTSAYVTLEFENAVAEIDPATRTVRRRLAVGHMPHFPMVVGNKLFVTDFGGASVSVIDRGSGATLAHLPVGIGPLGAGATRDGARVLVACHNSNEVAILDAAALKVEARVSTDAGPVQVSVAPDQAFAYVANDGAGTVQKIDLAKRAVVSTIPIGAGAGSHGIAFAPMAGSMFVTNTGRASVSVIDITRDAIVADIAVGPAPEGVAFLPA